MLAEDVNGKSVRAIRCIRFTSHFHFSCNLTSSKLNSSKKQVPRHVDCKLEPFSFGENELAQESEAVRSFKHLSHFHQAQGVSKCLGHTLQYLDNPLCLITIYNSFIPRRKLGGRLVEYTCTSTNRTKALNEIRENLDESAFAVSAVVEQSWQVPNRKKSVSSMKNPNTDEHLVFTSNTFSFLEFSA